MSSARKIILEIQELQKKLITYKGDKDPLYNDINLLAEKLIEITRNTYDATCEIYKELRTNDLQEFEQHIWDLLVKYINKYINKEPHDIKLLDIGASNGRDVLYSTKLGYQTYGIDNSEGFINMLKKYEISGQLKKGSIKKCDMRNLCFEDNTFDVVRHHATLLHLPIVAPGYMVDLALSETYRVLKPNGIVFALVKMGNGLAITDTAEGLGERVYQYFTHKTLNEVFQRNNFTILQTSDEVTLRKSGPIEWISIIAQKNI